MSKEADTLDTAALRDELTTARAALVAAYRRCQEADDVPEALSESISEASAATWRTLAVPVFSFVDWMKANSEPGA